ncbi:MAG: dynamin family protein [Thermoguttaceae bacterium]|nr:dynamin family protein [Thermoguttaceae bacterium]
MNSYKSNNSTSRSNLGKEKCKNCNQPISRGAPICYHCGELQQTYNLSPEAQKRLQNKVKELIHEYRSTEIDISELFDKSAQRYANACAQLQLMLNNETLQNSGLERIMERLSKVEALCKTREYSIAFVGKIKAGKSSLINEILGCDLASVNTVPETAALTKFRSSNDGLKLSITFYTSQDWDEIWKDSKADDDDYEENLFVQRYRELDADSIKRQYLNSPPKTFNPDSMEELSELLSKWTSAQFPEHYFVKEVEVQLDSLNLPNDVVLVDTPGLDDVIQYRSNLTRQYIKKANAVVVCVKCESYGSSQHDFIARNIANTIPENVFVLCTQIDAFNHPLEEWEKHKKEWLSYLKTKGCFGDKALAMQRVFGISSYIPRLLRQYDSGDEDVSYDLQYIAHKFGLLSPQQRRMDIVDIPELHDKDGSIRQQLLDYSGVNSLWNLLNNEIVNNYHSRFQAEIINAWKKCNNDIISTMRQNQDSCDSVISAKSNSLLKQKEMVRQLEEKREALKKERNSNGWSAFEREIREQFNDKFDQ